MKILLLKYSCLHCDYILLCLHGHHTISTRPSILLILGYVVTVTWWSNLLLKINLHKFQDCYTQLFLLTWSCVDNNVNRVSNAALRTDDIVWCKNGQTRGTKTVSDCWILIKKTQVNLIILSWNSIDTLPKYHFLVDLLSF